MIRRPYRQANTHSDVLTPLLQAAITAILIAAALGYASYEWDWPDSIIVPAFVVVLLGMWLLLLRSHRSHLWEYISQDDQPEPAPTPGTPQPQDWRVEITQHGPEKNRTNMSRLTIPAAISPDLMTAIAWETLRGTPFTERQWHGRGIEVPDFRALRHELLATGHMAWRVPGAPTQGVNLTEQGRDFFRQIAQEGRIKTVSPSPAPDDED